MEKITINNSITEDTIHLIGELITIDEADEQYGISDDVNFPFTDFSDTQKTYILRGDITIDGISVSKQDWSPFNLIIDGNLTVNGFIEWNEWGNGSFLHVTGNLKATNLFLAGCPEVIIQGDLEVTNGIVGSQGDNGGSLIVFGTTSSKLIYCTTYFNMEFSDRPNAFIIADGNDFIYDVDVDESDYDAVIEKVVSECQPDDEGEIDVDEVKEFLLENKSIIK